jgi:copper oxidase (laccase) domain-containing protein
VLEGAVEAMRALGADPDRTIAAIGPCIHQQSYEVGPEFEAQFRAADAGYARFFRSGADDRFQFDLPRFCAERLSAAGVRVVEILPHDTRSEDETLFSHRRSVAHGEPDYGRNCAAIAL